MENNTYSVWSKCFNCGKKTSINDIPVGVRAQQYVQEKNLEPVCFHCKCKLVTH